MKDRFYATGEGPNLTIYDLYDPRNVTGMKLLSRTFCGGLINRIAISSSRAYVAAQGMGLLIFDVSDPGVPALLGTYRPQGEITGIAVDETSLYVASGGQLQIIDAADPNDLKLLGTYGGRVSPRHFVADVATSGTLAALAVGRVWSQGGLEIVDVSDPGCPLK